MINDNQKRQTLIALFLVVSLAASFIHLQVLFICAIAVDNERLQSFAKVLSFPAPLMTSLFEKYPHPDNHFLGMLVVSSFWGLLGGFSFLTFYYFFVRS